MLEPKDFEDILNSSDSNTVTESEHEPDLEQALQEVKAQLEENEDTFRAVHDAQRQRQRK